MPNAINFNSSQSKAILHGSGPMLVIAGPGSGKTLVITHRIKNLIMEYKVKPENILVITFTKAAAIEMQYRFCSLMSEYNKSFPVNFGTCHAIFFQIIRDATAFDINSIIKENEKREIMEEILDDFLMDEDKELDASAETIQKLLSEISKVKNLKLLPEEYESAYCNSQDFIYIYKKYERECQKRRKLDFDDMLSMCLKLLQTNNSLLEKYQETFQYILIDEFQDINPVQYEIIKLLSMKNENIFVVGDDDQSIYGFRGATPNIMQSFTHFYLDAVKVELCENFRSVRQVVEASDRLIKNNTNRFPKSPASKNQGMGKVKYYSFEDRSTQYENISRCIGEYLKSNENKPDDVAILFRTNGHMGSMVNQLAKNGIPYSCKEKVINIYESEIAKDIIAYIRFALDESDVSAFYRIMNRPVRYIKRKLVPAKSFKKEEIIALQENENVIHLILQLYNHLEFIKKMEPYPAINFIRKGIGYDEFLKEQAKNSNNDLESETEIINEITEEAKMFRNFKDWFEYIKYYDQNLKKGYDNKKGVVISTMHGSKGLEWPLVIIPDVNEGIIPHKKARLALEVEEERRVFYVAMTRAKKYLLIFFINTKKGDPKGQPSRFLSECM